MGHFYQGRKSEHSFTTNKNLTFLEKYQKISHTLQCTKEIPCFCQYLFFRPRMLRERILYLFQDKKDSACYAISERKMKLLQGLQAPHAFPTERMRLKYKMKHIFSHILPQKATDVVSCREEGRRPKDGCRPELVKSALIWDIF